MIIMNKEEIYKNKFGNEWYDLLKEFLLSNSMNNIAYHIKKQRETSSIIPPEGSDLFFKVFKDLQPKNIKVIILGQD